MKYAKALKFAVGLCLSAVLSVTMVPLSTAQVYTITDLGPLSPTGINTWGQVVGNLNGHAYMWTRTRELRDLGTIPGGTFSRAAAINDLGVVTGTADAPGTVRGQQCSELIQPFIWTHVNGMQGLGVLDSYGPAEIWICPAVAFYAMDINVYGQVVGYTQDRATYQYGFSWTGADGMTLFGSSWPPTYLNGISDTAEVVGQNGNFGNVGIGHATSWNGGLATDLGGLGSGADSLYFNSSANGVNDLGEVVGWSTTIPTPLGECYFGVAPACPIHAVLWTPSEAIRDLGTLSGDSLSSASKINSFGHVIGTSGNTMIQQYNGELGGSIGVIGRPFIWTERSGMRDLNTLVRGNSKWVLQTATDINDWGQIVGTGTLKGKTHGFLLTPRQPLSRF